MSNKTIAKNTLILYFRMFFTMGVGLYTSRVVLNVLGIEEYGIYNVVGGVVMMFGFFNAAMTSATQRFLSYEIGKVEKGLANVFNASLNIHFLIGFLIILLAETVGLWFVNNKLNLPEDRMFAVNWIYQFSILTFFVSIIQVPYNALIIAREKMNIYAYMSLVEVFLKLGIVFLLVYLPFDKLITYAVLVFLVTFLITLFYKTYCKKMYKESRYKFYYDKDLYLTLISYSGWNLFGNIAAVARGQGVNFVLNIFYGTVLNAAYGITLQLQSAVNLFVNNFQVAANPQIIKTYSSGNINECQRLIYRSSKFSFFIMLIITIPIIINVDFVLKFWLKNVPNYTAIFVNLSLIRLLIDTISGPLMTGIQASGKIKWYQIVVGSLIFLNLPFAYLLIKIYNNPVYIYISFIIVAILSLFFRLYFLKINSNVNLKLFFTDSLLKIILVALIVFLITDILSNVFSEAHNVFTFVLSSILSIIFIGVTIYTIGMNKSERSFFLNIIKSRIRV